jgi:hypothetical protein
VLFRTKDDPAAFSIRNCVELVDLLCFPGQRRTPRFCQSLFEQSIKKQASTDRNMKMSAADGLQRLL